MSQSFADTSRHKGLVVTICNDEQGKRGYISFGKEFQNVDNSQTSQRWSWELWDAIFEDAVDKFISDGGASQYQDYKYSFDYALGVECGYWHWGG